MQVALVTGTSSGIGLATALHLARRGYRVFAGMRNPARGDELRAAVAADALPLEIIQLDVTDDGSVTSAVAQILARGAGLDVLVNNAGLSGAAPLEATPDAEHRAMFETNYWGAIRTIRAVLPSMRERRRGVIVNVSSVAGALAVPNQVAYSASKHALEAASEALAYEVRALGIRVAIIRPGVFATKIWENSAEATHYDRSSPYKQVMRRNAKMYVSLLREASPPERAAEVIFEAITSERPSLRYVVGDDAIRMIDGRSKISDEEWVDLGAEMSDEEFAERFRRAVGVELAGRSG